MPEGSSVSENESSTCVEAKKRSKTRWVLALLVVLALVGLGYFYFLRKSEKTIIIVDADGRVAVMGEATFQLSSSGVPSIEKKGLVFFRRDDTISGGPTGRAIVKVVKAGEIYRWDEKWGPKKVGTFDLDKSNKELAEEYGVKVK